MQWRRDGQLYTGGNWYALGIVVGVYNAVRREEPMLKNGVAIKGILLVVNTLMFTQVALRTLADHTVALVAMDSNQCVLTVSLITYTAWMYSYVSGMCAENPHISTLFLSFAHFDMKCTMFNININVRNFLYIYSELVNLRKDWMILWF